MLSTISCGSCGSFASNHTVALQTPNITEDAMKASTKQAVTLIFYRQILIFLGNKVSRQGLRLCENAFSLQIFALFTSNIEFIETIF